MIVIGTCAHFGSGQDTFARELAKRFQLEVISIGDTLRSIASERGLPATRENLRALRKELENNHGEDAIPTLIAQRIKESKHDTIVTGLRTIREYEVFKKEFSFHLVFVYADEGTRCQRVLARAETKDPITEEQFRDQEAFEREHFQIEELSQKSDEWIDCTMSLQQFLLILDQIVPHMLLARHLIARGTRQIGCNSFEAVSADCLMNC